jgi:hypothetical protein
MMEDLQNKRRHDAARSLNLNDSKELQAISEEEARIATKALKREALESSLSYGTIKSIATVMDKWFLDPLIGLFLPVIGDLLSTIMVLPYIYVSLFRVKSLPLTLAIIYNVLKDCLIGSIPIVGNIIDFFVRANLKNYQLIVGFVEDDRQIISEVNRKAIWTAILIIIFAILITIAVILIGKLLVLVGGLLTSLYNWLIALF